MDPISLLRRASMLHEDTTVTKGRYTTMSVVTDPGVVDVKIYDPEDNEVRSYYKNVFVDADGNKSWSVTFRATYTNGQPYASYMIRCTRDGGGA